MRLMSSWKFDLTSHLVLPCGFRASANYFIWFHNMTDEENTQRRLATVANAIYRQQNRAGRGASTQQNSVLILLEIRAEVTLHWDKALAVDLVTEFTYLQFEFNIRHVFPDTRNTAVDIQSYIHPDMIFSIFWLRFASVWQKTRFNIAWKNSSDTPNQNE